MIGLRVGPRSGRTGLAVGPGEDELHAFEATSLTVSLADSIDPAITFGLYSYTISVTNVGTETAIGVIVRITLDAQTTFQSGSGAGWSVSQDGNVITFTISAIVVGPAAPITVNVRASGVPETSTASVIAVAANVPIPATDTETTLVELVSSDELAQKYVPADATEWGRFRTFFGLAAATPDGLWLCQDASGSLAAAIGPTALTPVTSPLYRQTASGWTRLGVAGDDATNDRFQIPGGTAPDPTTSSQTWMVFTHAHSIPVANRQIVGIHITSSAAGCRLLISPLGAVERIQPQCVGAAINGLVDQNAGSHPYVIKYDRTNSVAVGYSDVDIVPVTYSAAIIDGSGKGFGGGVVAWGGCVYTYAAMWSGANAEISDADMRSLLQALNWTVTW